MMILRLTYVGELGYELHVQHETCGHVMEKILSREDNVTFAGTWAMESLAVEEEMTTEIFSKQARGSWLYKNAIKCF